MLSKIIKDIDILQFNSFQPTPCLHFSTTRRGGVSEGEYESFNLGNFSDDNIGHVSENRMRLAQALNISPDSLFIPHQTHGSKSFIIDESFLSQSKAEQEKLLDGIDALITQQKDICIGVTTADCVPILIYDPQKKVLAAIHAGWKGTVAHIAPRVVTLMASQFGCRAQDMLVGIAPSISPERFEVGDEVEERFQRAGFDLPLISFRNRNAGKLHIDLWTANKLSLIEAGISPRNIEVAELCTYSNPLLFFSARRQTIHSGRMLTGGIISSTE